MYENHINTYFVLYTAEYKTDVRKLKASKQSEGLVGCH